MRVVVCGPSSTKPGCAPDADAVPRSATPSGTQSGNIRSVVRALGRATEAASAASGGARSFEVIVTGDRADIEAADYVVVPGQGAFGSFARGIEGGLGDALREHIAKGRPYLGICLGMQVLFDSSDEAPGASGLGVLRGHVKRLDPGIDPSTSRPFALPHIGWNTVTLAGDATAPRYFYFAHSYAVVPDDPSVIHGTTEYGAERFTSAVRHDAVLGVQFHPEKSQREGLALLTRFFGT